MENTDNKRNRNNCLPPCYVVSTQVLVMDRNDNPDSIPAMKVLHFSPGSPNQVRSTENVPGDFFLCQLRVIVKMIVEKQMECRLAGETEVLGENLPHPHFCPSQNPT
jgi:hypothetical protein